MTANRKLLLASVFLVALLLRAAGLRTGLPSETGRLGTFHQDETITYYSLERMDPGSFDFYPGDSLYWGTFLVYLQGAVAKAMEVTGLLKLGNRDFILANLGEADKLYMSGRLISALFSAAAVFPLFLMGRRLAGERAAFLASFFFACSYVNAWMGSVVKPDGIMIFWGLMSALFAFRAAAGGGMRDFLLAGVFVGLSAVSKYTGVVFALPVALAWALGSRDLREGARTFARPLAAAGAAAAVYIAVNPYLLLRTGDVVAYMSTVAGKGAWPADPLHGYASYLGYTLPVSLGWPLFLFSAAGLLQPALRRSREGLIVLFFALAYFLKFGAPPDQVLTYCMPLTPFLCLAAGSLADRMAKRRWGMMLSAAAAVYTLAYAVYLQGFYARPSVMTMAGEWIAENIPSGSAIAIPKNDSWTPPEIRRHDAPYRVLTAGTPQGVHSDAIKALPAAAAGAEYLVLSEADYYQAAQDLKAGDPGTARVLEILESEFAEVKSFGRPLSRFFLPLYRIQESRQVRLTQLTTTIFRRKDRGAV